MSFTKLGGAIFAVGLVVIPIWAVVHYIVAPIVEFLK